MAKKKATKKKVVAKRKAGQPTKYKPEYCEAVIEYMKHGHSLTSFAAENGTTKATCHNWMKSHKEFFDAYKKARALCQSHWEKILHATATGKLKGNLGAQVFWMKNRFRDDWQDRIEQEVSVKHLEPVIIEDENGKSTTLTMKELDSNE
jgi:transposase